MYGCIAVIKQWHPFRVFWESTHPVHGNNCSLPVFALESRRVELVEITQKDMLVYVNEKYFIWTTDVFHDIHTVDPYRSSLVIVETIQMVYNHVWGF